MCEWKRFHQVLLASVVLFVAGGQVRAAGLPDQGFDDGAPAVSTDYYYFNEGTSANPLTFSTCTFPISQYPNAECDTGPAVYQQSNHYDQNMPAWLCYSVYGPCNHWTLILNNESAYNTENPGPPDASLPRSLPGHGIFGFATLYGDANFPGDTLWRAQMVLNLSSQFPNPDTIEKIPYMAIGAWNGWGSPGPVGVLNPSSSAGLTTIDFGERLWDFIPTQPWPQGPGQALLLDSYLMVTADWGSRPKSIQVNLFHVADDAHSYYDLTTWHPLNWNWPIVESVYHPGARILMVDAEDLPSLCGMSVPRLTYIGQEVNYSIDINALFHCANNATTYEDDSAQEVSGSLFEEPLPQTANIPITSVSWATEGSGRDGGIWVDVHSMRMVSGSQAMSSQLVQNQVLETPPEYGTATANIQQRLDALCDAERGCPQRAEASRQRDPSIYDEPKPTAKQLKNMRPLYYWRSGTSGVNPGDTRPTKPN